MAGQREGYSVHALTQCRDGTRRGTDTNMGAMMHGVSDVEIAALAHYMAQRQRGAGAPIHRRAAVSGRKARVMSDLLQDSILYWTFSSTTGDAYTGYTVVDTVGLGPLPVGALLPSPYGPAFGSYTVTNIVNYAVDLSAHYGIGYYTEGATVLSSYYDANTARSLPTYYGSQGIPTTYGGLGAEFDFVAVPFLGIPGLQPAGYFEVGYGGYYLIA